jgi:predicted DsbA family dithiol-disulfide isomerase
MSLTMPAIRTRSRRAHEAAKWAATHDRLNEFHLAIFRAFFQEGRDIGRLEELLKPAADQGLDPEALKRSLENHEFTLQVVADKEDVMNIGVRALPASVAAGCGGRPGAAGGRGAERRPASGLVGRRTGPGAFKVVKAGHAQ